MKDSLRQNLENWKKLDLKKALKKAFSGTNSVSFNVHRLLKLLIMIAANRVNGADETRAGVQVLIKAYLEQLITLSKFG